MNIKETVGTTFDIFIKEPKKFVIATLIALLVTVVTLGILAPVMWLGMGEMFRKTKAGGITSYDDLFIHLDKAIILAVMSFVVFICIAIGTVMLLVPGVIIATIWMYSTYYMVDNNTGILASLKSSAFTVNKNNLMNHIVVVICIWLIMAIGTKIVIGILVAYPLCAGFMTLLFDEEKEKQLI
ncbi:MAG: hypothetical protein WCJ94_03320 [bacterium]